MTCKRIIAPRRLAGFYANIQYDERGNLLVEIPFEPSVAYDVQDPCSKAVGVPVHVVHHKGGDTYASLVFTCAPGVVTFEDERRVDS